jgi:arginase
VVGGRGPAVVANLEGRRPLVRDEDALVFAFRDAEHAAAEGSQPLPPTLRALDLATVRGLGVERAVREALAHLEREDGPLGFWIHLDADVLDDSIMPAVDYRLRGGLRWGELSAVLRAAVASPRAVGLEITIFNPTLDADGRIAHGLVDALVEGLAR